MTGAGCHRRKTKAGGYWSACQMLLRVRKRFVNSPLNGNTEITGEANKKTGNGMVWMRFISEKVNEPLRCGKRKRKTTECMANPPKKSTCEDRQRNMEIAGKVCGLVHFVKGREENIIAYLKDD